MEDYIRVDINELESGEEVRVRGLLTIDNKDHELCKKYPFLYCEVCNNGRI